MKDKIREITRRTISIRNITREQFYSKNDKEEARFQTIAGTPCFVIKTEDIADAIYQATRLDPEKMSALINPDNTNFKDYDKAVIELICLKQDELTKE